MEQLSKPIFTLLHPLAASKKRLKEDRNAPHNLSHLFFIICKVFMQTLNT